MYNKMRIADQLGQLRDRIVEHTGLAAVAAVDRSRLPSMLSEGT
jgi:hypothetical protein